MAELPYMPDEIKTGKFDLIMVGKFNECKPCFLQGAYLLTVIMFSRLWI